jgi:hypothetical protein
VGKFAIASQIEWQREYLSSGSAGSPKSFDITFQNKPATNAKKWLKRQHYNLYQSQRKVLSVTLIIRAKTASRIPVMGALRNIAFQNAMHIGRRVPASFYSQGDRIDTGQYRWSGAFSRDGSTTTSKGKERTSISP